MPYQPNRTLEYRILELLKQSRTSTTPIALREILRVLSGKGRFLMVMLLALPFCQPIQLPGMSLPFGLAIAFMGMRIAFGKHIWLPNWIKTKTITRQTFRKIAISSLLLMRKIRHYVHPRMFWISTYPPMRIFNGLLICVMGLLLALPIPIPLTNLVAAWSIFLVSFGLFEDNGVLVVIGYLIALLAVIFFGMLALGLNYAFDRVNGIH
jgi:hypothetical protein